LLTTFETGSPSNNFHLFSRQTPSKKHQPREHTPGGKQTEGIRNVNRQTDPQAAKQGWREGTERGAWEETKGRFSGPCSSGKTPGGGGAKAQQRGNAKTGHTEECPKNTLHNDFKPQKAGRRNKTEKGDGEKKTGCGKKKEVIAIRHKGEKPLVCMLEAWRYKPDKTK